MDAASGTIDGWIGMELVMDVLFYLYIVSHCLQNSPLTSARK